MKDDSLGIYISIPFCKAKCSFCNFASGVFAPERLDGYVDRVCAEVRDARCVAHGRGARLPERVDTVYFGGGTPSLLEPKHLQQLFAALRGEFALDDDAEITLEAVPGQVAEATLEEALRVGVNRVSFGVQSFIDRESAAVGRLHTAAECYAEIARMRSAGVGRISLDLIAGLPDQTRASWAESVDQAIGTSVDHVSVYLLEVDEDSRLGRESIAGGSRYGAAALPSEDDAADFYLDACDRLGAAALEQYEISNFARPGYASRHNLKYWTRQPYFGVGLDAHSMLFLEQVGEQGGSVAIRWANPDEMHGYAPEAPAALRILASAATSPFSSGGSPELERIRLDQAFEETFFLGLRLTEGIDLDQVRLEFGDARMEQALDALATVASAGLVARSASRVRLTAKGRLASNEVFSRLLVA